MSLKSRSSFLISSYKTVFNKITIAETGYMLINCLLMDSHRENINITPSLGWFNRDYTFAIGGKS